LKGNAMPNLLKTPLFSIFLAAMVLAPSALLAQAPGDPPAAALPSAILSAKKAFVSNSSGESLIALGVSELTYNEFCAALRSWGRYELVAAPADADLVFEIRYTPDDQLHLIVRDPKTNVVLWAFTEVINKAQRQAAARKNFDGALANLITDLKKLTV
jgi:hypothetical protein